MVNEGDRVEETTSENEWEAKLRPGEVFAEVAAAIFHLTAERIQQLARKGWIDARPIRIAGVRFRWAVNVASVDSYLRRRKIGRPYANKETDREGHPALTAPHA